MNELMYSLKIYAYTIEYIIYYKTCTSRMHGHLLSFGVAIWGGGGGGGGGGPLPKIGEQEVTAVKTIGCMAIVLQNYYTYMYGNEICTG